MTSEHNVSGSTAALRGSTRVLGVFGHPVSHSLSPVIQNAAIRAMNLDYVYVPFHVLPEKLGTAVEGIRSLDLAGVNVTIPHKERVIGYLDEVSEYARSIGSVNTIINEDGHLRGDSTDGPGFLRSMTDQWGKMDGCRALILGAGGSAKAISFTLAGIGCELAIANRTAERARELAASLSEGLGRASARAIGLDGEELAIEAGRADLLVNTTSVGMIPEADGIPLPPEMLKPNLLVYDLVYNPLETRLVREARSRGLKAMSGLKMLVYQGALSLEMWTGRKAPVDTMEKAAMGPLLGS